MKNTRHGITVDEAYQSSVGEFGRGQKLIFTLINLTWCLVMMNVFLMMFVELDPVIEGLFKCYSHVENVKQCERLLDPKMSQLIMKNDFYKTFCQLPSHSWIWTSKERSLVSTFDLECGGMWKITLLQTCYFLGILLGAPFFTLLSDNIGRKISLYISIFLSALSLLFCSFAPNFWIYFGFRIFSGFGCGGEGSLIFILTSDLIGPSVRNQAMLFGQGFTTIGSLFICGFSWLLQSWQETLLVISIIHFIFLLTYNNIPESPKWLLLKARKGDATAILAALAFANKTKPPEMPLLDAYDLYFESMRSISQVFKHKRLRKWLLILSFSWFSVSFLYYGITFLLPSLPYSIYFSFFITSILELGAILMLFFLIEKIGRKTIYFWGFIIGSAGLLIMGFIPSQMTLLFAVLSRLSTFAIFTLSYIYTIEILPSSLTNVVIGYVSTFAKIGALFTPIMTSIAIRLGFLIPLIILSTFGVISGLLTIGLPETFGVYLPNTIEEVDEKFIVNVKKKRQWFRWYRRNLTFDIMGEEEEAI